MTTTYRIWDPSVLDNPADFTIEMALPEGKYVEKNPDGTTPVASLKVEATSLKFALSALMQLHGGDEIIDGVLATILGEDYVDVVNNKPEEARKAMEVDHSPFLSVEFTAKGDNDIQSAMTLRAPNGIVALQVFDELTTSKRLNALATSFMPVDEDYMN